MSPILRLKLLRHFGRDVENYTDLERQQAEYVYQYAATRLNSDNYYEIISFLVELEQVLELKRRSQKLNRLYQHLKMVSMMESGRYDFDTAKPPQDSNPYSPGWKVS